MSKDLLLVTSKILGSGHYNAAKNLETGLKKQTDYQIDFYDWDFFGGKAYEFMLRNVPRVWHMLNETLQNEFFLSFTKMQDNWNSLTDKTKEKLEQQEMWWQLRYNLFDLEDFLNLNDLFEQEGVSGSKRPEWSQFEKIFLTMPGAQSLGYSNYFSDRTSVLVTDYGQVDKAWTVYTPKTFFVPNQAAADYLRSFKDLQNSQIVISGIPVNPLTKELSQTDRYDLRKKLNIKSKRFFVLAGGGAGGRNIANMVETLLKNNLPESQILVVCGRNDLLYKSLKSKVPKNSTNYIKLVKFIDNNKMLEYCRAADMVITKPGGITTTELINLNTPIGVYYFHPQEEGNLEHIKDNRLGILNLKAKDFVRELQTLDDDDYEYFSKKMRKVARYDTIESIIQHLQN